MGDFMRGVNVRELPRAIAHGVQNHKAVDRFTDSHDGVRQLKVSFSSQRRRFAGIIIDVVFDHFLIKHWRDYSGDALSDFTAFCYDGLASMRQEMPPRMQQRVDWMIHYDLLNSYAGLKGVSNALNGISQRMRFENRLAGAIEEVENHYVALEQGFLAFFSELCTHVQTASIEIQDNNSQSRADRSHKDHSSDENSLTYRHQSRRLFRSF